MPAREEIQEINTMQLMFMARNAALLAVLCGVAAVGQQSLGYLKRASILAGSRCVNSRSRWRRSTVQRGKKSIKIETGKVTIVRAAK
jgi:hypothetical protein